MSQHLPALYLQFAVLKEVRRTYLDLFMGNVAINALSLQIVGGSCHIDLRVMSQNGYVIGKRHVSKRILGKHFEKGRSFASICHVCNFLGKPRFSEAC